MDVKTAFLNGNLDEEVFIDQLEGFMVEGKEHMWYLKFNDTITSCGFKENIVDRCIYLKTSMSKFIILVLYVDDILLATNDFGLLCQTKEFISKNFEIKDMGEAFYVIGIEIFRDRTHGLLVLSQKAYINKTYTRPNISFAVGMLGRYQSNPGMDYWKAAKKVLRYLQGTKDYMLTYKRSDHLEVIRYSNSDFAGCVDTRKSTFGYLFMLAEEVISWKSAKQSIIAASTMEAEFVACFEATVHGLWLRNFISGLGIVDSIAKLLRIYCDNSAAVFF
ncbi:Retrovirus-related Pol polyprotein from transposon TNT 1-94 [Cucumis melo var. makuwa]|uniref:Retrovirus-related Pol polyprotein from transposon TNT 1-94 n=1 Tax=Cucumis melo var. makuwa TaxID=1194695 RepID=A0A5D3DAK2_CUCMM|nr:Retrovirus-related Pol polyprotein from transposon TNT 1-94 [Cucumis melo var. makuwa]TYK20529.1 Retrovirus-related Pol polyprotein from transposon TNT 1-94 [Cucumis melo var. makuwa]